MRGIKGSAKTFGEPCAHCGTPLNQENALFRRPPRQGLLSYCRQCHNAKANASRERNPETHRQRCRDYRAKLRKEILEAYGGKCVCCGETIPEFLALDHVNGGGNIHRKRDHLTAPAQLYRQVRDQGFPDTYRLLCHNCNSAIAWYGRCPHANSQPM